MEGFSRLMVAVACSVGLSLVSSAAMGLDSATKCEAGKLKTTGKLGACRLKVESKAVKKGTTPDFAKCEAKFTEKFNKSESKAGPGVCPSEGDESAIRAGVSDHTDRMAILLSGGVPPGCGDGTVGAGEQCDGTDLAGADCTSLGFASGTLACDASCAFDVTGCAVNTCGDGTVGAGEQCDGTDLAGADCASLGFAGGTLACDASCALDLTGCTLDTCGNGVVDGFEQCDGSDLAGVDCVSLGFAGGTLACDASCAFDLTGCTLDTCGNGVVDGFEQCDGSDLAGMDCVSLGFAGGTLVCDASCVFNPVGCMATCGTCGNGIADGFEQCDGSDLAGADCATLGFGGGTLACTPGCAYDTSPCLPPLCAPPILPETGQVTSFVAGDDGDVRAGAPFAYVNNGDGTVTDLNTGLMWESKSDDGSLHDWDNCYPWAGTCSGSGSQCGTDIDCPGGETCDAGDCQVTSPLGVTIFEWVEQLNAASFAGHSDWRIPNMRELQSIVDFETFPGRPTVDSTFDFCGPGCAVTVCSCTKASYYWSSTTNASYSANAWDVNFNSGFVNINGKTNLNFVRAVRGGL